MSTTLARPKKRVRRYLPDVQNFITILPPGRTIAEKMSEMGIDAAELAQRMGTPVETIEKLLRFEIPLTESLAKKLEKATLMPADVMMRFERRYRENLAYAMEHPEIPAYLAGEIINQPKRAKKGGKTSER